MKLSATLIYGLTVCILLVSSPHAGHLPLWISGTALLLLGWRVYLSHTGQHQPPRWLLVCVTLACVGGIALGFRALFGREVGVALLVLLSALKMLELRTTRDASVLIYLACFIMLTQFLYSQTLATGLFTLFALLVVTTTWIHLHTGTLGLKPRLGIATRLLAQAIPLTLLLFVLFPRVSGPLWGLPQDAYASSGLSDTMSPGSMSKLTLSDAVAFRVTFKGAAPPRQQMYWRGPVLWDFDGRSWARGRSAVLAAPAQLEYLGPPLDYTVTLEAHNKPWLFALEMPRTLSIPHDRLADFQLLNKAPVNSRLRYEATSSPNYRADRLPAPQQLQRALALPAGFNPRALRLAADWRRQNPDDEQLINTALNYFNRNAFAYTLEPPPLGRDTVDEFLFTTRRGFCEYYASSFVFLMRAAGIPARVVTGYQGGEYNDLGAYYILRQSDAHAWTEVWLKERGWVRYDPTAAIAPERIQNSLSNALTDNTALPLLSRTRWPLLLNLRANLDALTNQWNQWVLGYDNERQFALLTRLGIQGITWQKLVLYLLAGVTLLVAIFTLFFLRRLRPQRPDPVQTVYLSFCKRLARAGITRAPHEGPQDFSARAAALRPQHATAIRDITTRYLALRYGGQQDRTLLQAFGHAVRRFKL